MRTDAGAALGLRLSGRRSVVLWFAGLALVIVWAVFHDPAIDHRLVVAGALAPDVLDLWRGGDVGPAHALVFSVGLLAGVMLATRGRRRLRRRLLAVPIGTFLHLVLDGAWARTEVFWWPLSGWDIPGRLPVLDRTVGAILLQELAGVVALAWCWHAFGLASPDARRRLLATGRLQPRPSDGDP